MAKEKESSIKKIANVWTKMSNPLRFLNNLQIEQMLNQAKFGNDSKLQLCFFECERNNPVFSACINKRISGVQNRKWDITTFEDNDKSRMQAEAVKKMFLKADSTVEDNLTNALRHLTLGSFRGRAAVKPFVNEDGDLIFKCIDNWNFLRYNGKIYWNPEISETPLISDNLDSIVELPKDEVCYVYDDKPIDWIGIQIYLRQLIGEEAYARFIEKSGIPQVLLTCPEGTPETDLNKFDYRAQAIYEGASGTLPFGTVPHLLTEGRSQDPFTAFITHQSEMFCILATGGTLDVLAGTQGSSGTGMGSSVSDNQADLFLSLVNYDCKRIQNAMQVAVEKCIKSLFGEGAECLCKFEFVEKDDVKPEQYIDLAMKLQGMGIAIDAAKLKQLTNLEFIKDDIKDVWKPTSEQE